MNSGGDLMFVVSVTVLRCYGVTVTVLRCYGVTVLQCYGVTDCILLRGNRKEISLSL